MSLIEEHICLGSYGALAALPRAGVTTAYSGAGGSAEPCTGGPRYTETHNNFRQMAQRVQESAVIVTIVAYVSKSNQRELQLTKRYLSPRCKAVVLQVATHDGLRRVIPWCRLCTVPDTSYPSAVLSQKQNSFVALPFIGCGVHDEHLRRARGLRIHGRENGADD